MLGSEPKGMSKVSQFEGFCRFIYQGLTIGIVKKKGLTIEL